MIGKPTVMDLASIRVMMASFLEIGWESIVHFDIYQYDSGRTTHDSALPISKPPSKSDLTPSLVREQVHSCHIGSHLRICSAIQVNGSARRHSDTPN